MTLDAVIDLSRLRRFAVHRLATPRLAQHLSALVPLQPSRDRESGQRQRSQQE
jgi:hypothetical protein